MKLRSRILSLLALALCGFFVALAVLQWVQDRNVRWVYSAVAAEKRILLTKLVNVTGAPLRQLTRDYTQWTEMCDFLARPTAEWAKINIDTSLETWRFHAAWLYRANGELTYATNRLGDDSLKILPIDQEQIIARLRDNSFLHFYLSTKQGVLEICTAPIQPSEDNDRKTPPQGWMLVGKLWDEAHLTQLAELAGGNVVLLPPDSNEHAASDQEVQVSYSLADWQGAPLRRLDLSVSPAMDAVVKKGDESEWILFIVCGSALLVGVGWSIRRLVLRPLEQISDAIQRDTPAPLAGLARSTDEFGHVARLFESSLRHKLALQIEVEERRRAEKALRESLEERSRLGRDLHDRTIQSIYAAGLKIEGAMQSLHSSRPEAEKRLTETVANLNDVITELRHVIAGTDPKEQPGMSLARGLRELADGVRASHRMSCVVELDEAAVQTLTRDERDELFAIAREAISNALRHSQATRIALRFAARLPARWLEVTDDGVGFTPANLPDRGHGLDNMTRRAEEIGAEIEIDSAPGKGTRIRVELAPPTLRFS